MEGPSPGIASLSAISANEPLSLYSSLSRKGDDWTMGLPPMLGVRAAQLPNAKPEPATAAAVPPTPEALAAARTPGSFPSESDTDIDPVAAAAAAATPLPGKPRGSGGCVAAPLRGRKWSTKFRLLVNVELSYGTAAPSNRTLSPVPAQPDRAGAHPPLPLP
ncbi:hypothetical protein Vafri_12098 [Volvox africanus]|uniref:Uncharacterized protein n=1 Tax=Volvox africanus TaxID=51714 RepID=A0A8J4B9B1_9CHLO|nr:hypothetical protein Vafri_12098 [Volvox africanus]